MTKKETYYRANIGSPSLILLFIVMCLVTFGVLSLSAAKNEWNLANRNALAVTEYYRADSVGEEFYQMVKEKQEKVCMKSEVPKERKQLFKKELGENYFTDTGSVVIKIPMEHSQALTIELIPEFDEDRTMTVSKWKVIHTQELAIDQSMPVWTGENSKE